VSLQEIVRRYDEARCAEATLYRPRFDESLLQGMQSFTPGHSLDSNDLPSFGLAGEN
jgi:hypothetical protein